MSKSMQNTTEMDKVETLIEALPYIKDFRNRIFVIKLGGSMLVDEEIRMTILEDIALLKFVGINPILVHGGGKDINALSEKLGLKTKFVEGLRHTDDSTLDVVRMVLGKVNSEIVEELESQDCKAIGTTGKTGSMIKARRIEKLGNVGEIEKVDVSVIQDFLDDGYVPVIQPIGLDEHDKAVNINADDLAAAIAKSMKAEKLMYLTNVPGLLEDEKDEKTLISSITTKDLKDKLKWEELQGGMIPKVKGVIDAIEHGVKNVHMIDGRVRHSVLLEVFTDRGIGTMVTE
jgi:acetylglutamate kinase